MFLPPKRIYVETEHSIKQVFHCTSVEKTFFVGLPADGSIPARIVCWLPGTNGQENMLDKSLSAPLAQALQSCLTVVPIAVGSKKKAQWRLGPEPWMPELISSLREALKRVQANTMFIYTEAIGKWQPLALRIGLPGRLALY